MSRIIGMTVTDVRFPTSRDADGSDAMNESPDYSAAYVELDTDADDGNRGVGFVFTIGRGNDVQCAAIEALRPMVVGRDVEASLTDMGGTWREFVHDSQLRWLGPEKGVAHMAIGAVVNALWDLRAKREGMPLWRLLAGLDPEQIVDLVDFRYLTDAITPDEALNLLRAAVPGRSERLARLEAVGYPAYTTTPGWLGYDDAKLDRLCREAVADGFEQIKLKVGGDLEDDVRRLGIARAAIGPDVRLAIDANQRWDVEEAVRWVRRLQPFDLAWIEEPTSPDDILGHATIAHAVAPTPVATGEHMANRVVAKQLIQAGAAEVLQIDATRVAGVNENIAILLLAAKHGVRVCPHAGGVGLCEAVQHLSMFDAVAVSGRLDDRCIEFVDHLHEHFRTPVVVRGGRYVAPSAPGAGTEMWPESVRRFTFPHGPEWAPSAVDASTAPARHVVVRTRLLRGEEARYEALHATVPDALADRLRAAGVSQWRIHRDGVDLIHVIDVADHRAMRTALAGDPVNVAWQELVNPLLEQPDDYSGQDDGLPLVWSLR